MNIQVLVGKRCLLKVPRGIYGVDRIEEYRILEISPSGNWVKLMNLYGNKFWQAITDVSYVEELRDLKAEREKETT